MVSASDADEAYQKLRDTPSDLVLLDPFLPKVNGVEVLKAIRSKAALVAPPTASNEELEKTIQLLPTLQGEPRDRWHGLVIAEHEFRKAKVKDVTVAVEKLSEASDVLRVGLLQQMCSGLLPFLAHPKMTSVELLPVMRRARLSIVSAKEVTPAPSLCAQNRFNLILWDADLPGPSTLDILHRLHTESSNKETPVTFITKSDDFEARAKEAAAGAALLQRPNRAISRALGAPRRLL